MDDLATGSTDARLAALARLLVVDTWTDRTRAALAWQVAFGGFCLMAISLFIGSHILAFFGLTITAVQIAGGLVVTASGWKLLQQGADVREREQQAPVPDNLIMRRAFYPLTLPLTVGPGTISVAITLGTRGANAQFPLMVVIGSRDPLRPPWRRISRALAEVPPQVTIVLFQGAAHAINFSHPRELAHAIGQYVRGEEIRMDATHPDGVPVLQLQRPV